MTEPTPTDIEMKKADAVALIEDLNAIKAKLDLLKPESRWFGGLPPTFEQLYTMAEHHARVIQQVFELS